MPEVIFEGLKKEFPSLSDVDALKATQEIERVAPQATQALDQHPVETVTEIEKPQIAQTAQPQQMGIPHDQMAERFKEQLSAMSDPAKMAELQKKYSDNLGPSIHSKILSVFPRTRPFAGMVDSGRQARAQVAQTELANSMEAAKMLQSQIQFEPQQAIREREQAIKDKEAAVQYGTGSEDEDPASLRSQIAQAAAVEMFPQKKDAILKSSKRQLDSFISEKGPLRDVYEKRQALINTQMNVGAKDRATGARDRATQAKMAVEQGKIARTAPEAVFNREQSKIAAKNFEELQKSAKAVDLQLELLDDAFKTFDQYSRKSPGGTGPLATGFGGSQYLSADTQNLQSKFNMINLKNMAATFEGMSRAVDTDTERRAWNATQPDISNDDLPNYNILLGSKALAMKAKMEAQAQKQWVQSGQSMENYTTPIFGKTSAMVAPNGDIQIVRKGQEAEYGKRGFLPLDEFARRRSR